MFQATRRRLALWYTAATAVLLLLFATGFYLYVRDTLVERVDDTLNHVVEVVQRSLVIEPDPELDRAGDIVADINSLQARRDRLHPPLRVNLEASFRSNADAVEDDHIDLEWFSPAGELLWSTFSAPLNVPLHLNNSGETVYGRVTRDLDLPQPTSPLPDPLVLRQITQQVQVGQQVLGYLRASHPWFEVSKPSRQLIRDLALGTTLIVIAVAAIGWFLSGLAIAPVRDSYQRLKQFTADASHELRNPIAVIQTNVQVALADPDPHWQQDQLRVVERLTRRLGRLVDDLLFLARQDSGITPLKLETVQLETLLREVVEEQQTIAAEKALLLTLTVAEAAAPDAAYSLFGDRDQLIRLFTNLLGNAIQYTPTGNITVTLQRQKQAGTPVLQVQVQDTGVGIPAEAVQHLFDRFYRVDPARRSGEHLGKMDSGSGLGLALVKAIVENHQGQIHVESTLQQGTTFTVMLPCQRTEAAKGIG
ncbi:HAMP domain-containing histidine kinase [Phormidium tenue FACHB-886]|nr:HAMP domain-containing histidine kinase [Phormidium tenue FACHB-886]